MAYYKVIKNISELDYIMFRHTVFQCKWVENNNNIKIDELGFTQVNFNREGQKEGIFNWHLKQNKFFTLQIMLIKSSLLLSTKPSITPDNN